MYYTGKPEFEFGDGLSYDAWSLKYSAEEGAASSSNGVVLTTDAGSKNTFNVVVQNKGTFGGRCTIIAFWRPKGHLQPLRQKMFGFDGVQVGAGGSASLRFELTAEHLAVADVDGHQIVIEGDYEVFFKGAGVGELLHVPVTVTGSPRTVTAFGH